MVEQVEVPVGELIFRARVAGPPGGPLVILLHGFPQSSWAWRAQIEALAQSGYRVVAPDQRGYSPGARPERLEAYRAEHLVADVVAIADWMGGHTFHLVGHDWGGVVAWLLAGRYPDRLRTLSVVSMPHPLAFARALASTNDDQRLRSSYIRFFQQSDTPEQALLRDGGEGLRTVFANLGLTAGAGVEEYVRLMSEPGAMTGAINWYRAIDVRLIEDMGPITTPTLYVWSTDDIGIGREAAEATVDYVHGPYRYEVLEGVSHWIPEESPEILNRMLLQHLATPGI